MCVNYFRGVLVCDGRMPQDHPRKNYSAYPSSQSTKQHDSVQLTAMWRAIGSTQLTNVNPWKIKTNASVCDVVQD